MQTSKLKFSFIMWLSDLGVVPTFVSSAPVHLSQALAEAADSGGSMLPMPKTATEHDPILLTTSTSCFLVLVATCCELPQAADAGLVRADHVLSNLPFNQRNQFLNVIYLNFMSQRVEALLLASLYG
jgi:hypothetical protein